MEDTRAHDTTATQNSKRERQSTIKEQGSDVGRPVRRFNCAQTNIPAIYNRLFSNLLFLLLGLFVHRRAWLFTFQSRHGNDR